MNGRLSVIRPWPAVKSVTVVLAGSVLYFWVAVQVVGVAARLSLPFMERHPRMLAAAFGLYSFEIITFLPIVLLSALPAAVLVLALIRQGPVRHALAVGAVNEIFNLVGFLRGIFDSRIVEETFRLFLLQWWPVMLPEGVLFIAAPAVVTWCLLKLYQRLVAKNIGA
ncbi:MAG: hypothetical protein ACYDB9_11420, partial [Gammaproteobacteria bacterium]